MARLTVERPFTITVGETSLTRILEVEAFKCDGCGVQAESQFRIGSIQSQWRGDKEIFYPTSFAHPDGWLTGHVWSDDRWEVAWCPGCAQAALMGVNAYRETLCDILALALPFRPEEHEVKEWSPADVELASKWAGAIHLSASDNDDVEVPPEPMCILRLRKARERASR